jgi:formate dehydrogenase major subunit
MVTARIQPLQVNGRTLHQIGLPFHWSYAGEVVGCQANDLTSLVCDPNVSMHEAKVFTCDIAPGRAPSATPQPTVPVSRWPTEKPIPATPPPGQPEGQIRMPRGQR